MKYSDNSINIITAITFKGIGRAWIHKNLKGNESVETIVELLNKKLSNTESEVTIEKFENKKKIILHELQRFKEFCDGIVAIGDKNFPKFRGNVNESERPIFLFYKGNLDLLNEDNFNISVIGLLNPDEKIEEREKKLVAEIVKHNITIVSGLALGCDTIAHKQAIIGGKTIAILPSPLYNILPMQNRKLAFDIIDGGGLLISEYFNDHKSLMDLNSRYVERDRLQALYCDAIVLIASYAKNSADIWKELSGKKLDSGSRHAMEFAKKYNIPRAVMYDQNLDSNNPMFDLNRQLITEQNSIIILTQKSLEELIKKIKNKNIRYIKYPTQEKLFE